MVEDEKLLFSVIRASFEQRRKTLVNSLAGSGRLLISKQQAADAIAAAGLSPSVRGEALGLGEFARLSDALKRL